MLKDYPNYGITKSGVIYNLKRKRRKITNYWLGYEKVNLSKNNKTYTEWVHRLVAITFIENKEGKPEVNHKDGNRKNNTVENLEWVTRSENQKHSFTHLGRVHPMKGRFGKNHPKSKNYVKHFSS